MFDAATLTVLVGAFVLIASAFVLKFASFPAYRIRSFLAVATVVWLVISILGEFVTGWATNNMCYAYLGCNDGFFGYDAVEHFVFGFALVFAFLWLGRMLPTVSFVAGNRTKTVLTLLAHVALVAVVWEMVECGWDQYRITILHETLFSFRLHVDQLAQSSNLDTMGDILCTILGALFSSAMAEFLEPQILKTTKRN
jgi:hypothetical protein